MITRERPDVTRFERLLVQLCTSIAIGAALPLAGHALGAYTATQEVKQQQDWNRRRAVEAFAGSQMVSSIAGEGILSSERAKILHEHPRKVLAGYPDVPISTLEENVQAHRSKAVEFGLASGFGLLGSLATGVSWGLRRSKVRQGEDWEDDVTEQQPTPLRAVAAEGAPGLYVGATLIGDDEIDFGAGELGALQEIIETQPERTTWSTRMRKWVGSKVASCFEEYPSLDEQAYDIHAEPRDIFSEYRPTSTMESIPLDYTPTPAPAAV